MILKSFYAKLLLVFAVMLIGTTLASAQEKDSAKTGINVEAQICTVVENRAPVGLADTLQSDVGQVYCWTKIIGAQDTTFVTHVWVYNDSEMARVKLPVRSSSWRTWSSKKILPAWVGAWEVKVLDAEDNLIKSIPFTIIPVKTSP